MLKKLLFLELRINLREFCWYFRETEEILLNEVIFNKLKKKKY